MRESALPGDLAACRDEDIVRAFQAGSHDVFSLLVARYLRLVRVKACSFREIFSLEQDDLFQEGLLGLFDAVGTYTFDGRASFATYAGKCINNRIVSAVRRSASRKNAILNNAVSIDEASDVGADASADPQSLLEMRDDVRSMMQAVQISLSPFEQRILSLYLGGYKRTEIEERLHISKKSFENAMARVRKKLRQK